MLRQVLRINAFRHARWQQATFGLPAYALRTWLAQREIAAGEGVAFRFTLFQWQWWWRLELRRLGIRDRHGVRCGRYRMRRIDDRGDYAPGNVVVERVPPIPKVSRSERMRQWHAVHGTWLTGRRGDDHPRSRAVVTPRGRFGSVALAAEAYGISRQSAHRRALLGRNGWKFEC